MLRRGGAGRSLGETNLVEYILPDLPYDYAALGPWITSCAEARDAGDVVNVNRFERGPAQLVSVIDPSSFLSLSPVGQREPAGELAGARDHVDYRNVKVDSVAASWNVVNWENVQARFTAARDNSTRLLVLS
jgi:hypothetical protein